MKKIVIVTDAWHPQVNGVVRTLTKCRDLMIERGYDVTIISPLDYRSVPCPTYPEIRLALTTPGSLRRRLTAMRPDYVHIATEGPLGVMTRRACLKMGWSFTTSFHTRFPEYLEERFPIPPRWTYAFLRRFHNAAQHTLVPTQSILDDLKGQGFTRLELWTRGVDRTLFYPRSERIKELPRPVFICVGRVAAEKTCQHFWNLIFPARNSSSETALSERFACAVSRSSVRR